MNTEVKKVQKTYITIILLQTLAASFIWGINTLFLLDAGLSNTEAFAANAFFTLGMVIFEVPTGVVADTWGRRASFLLGAFTLLITTVLYYIMWQTEAPFWQWAIASALIGLGFTFFSGAVEAWLVDALSFTKYKGSLESMFAKGQVTAGVAMLSGSVAGGFIAQVTDLGVPYILRAVILGITLVVAWMLMKDLGFKPVKAKSVTHEMRQIVKASIDNGLKNRPVRWVMLAAPFSAGVGIYAFYAMQPYLLELYGDETAYGVAGLAAAIVAGAQIAGGLLVNTVRKIFKSRTTILILGVVSSVILLTLIGAVNNFFIVVSLIVLWAIIFALTSPVRQAYLNGLIPSKQRATVLSFDSLMSSSGGIVTQPALGKSADVWSYGVSYVIAAAIQFFALPFLFFAKKEKAKSDPIKKEANKAS